VSTRSDARSSYSVLVQYLVLFGAYCACHLAITHTLNISYFVSKALPFTVSIFIALFGGLLGFLIPLLRELNGGAYGLDEIGWERRVWRLALFSNVCAASLILFALIISIMVAIWPTYVKQNIVPFDEVIGVAEIAALFLFWITHYWFGKAIFFFRYLRQKSLGTPISWRDFLLGALK
jgi:phosphatidylglycerophosphatase A